MTEREQFEATFSAPPYEFRMERWGDRAVWAGNYKSYYVQCAWDGYQEARAALAQPVAAEPADPATAPGGEKFWSCTIGGRTAGLPSGSDAPMRRAIMAAFAEVTGFWPEHTFSGWGEVLTEAQRAVAENRMPPPPTPA